MSAPGSRPVTRTESHVELRWSQWLANGAIADTLLHKRAVAIAVVAGCAIGAWLAVAIYLG